MTTRCHYFNYASNFAWTKWEKISCAHAVPPLRYTSDLLVPSVPPLKYTSDLLVPSIPPLKYTSDLLVPSIIIRAV